MRNRRTEGGTAQEVVSRGRTDSAHYGSCRVPPSLTLVFRYLPLVKPGPVGSDTITGKQLKLRDEAGRAEEHSLTMLRTHVSVP